MKTPRQVTTPETFPDGTITRTTVVVTAEHVPDPSEHGAELDSDGASFEEATDVQRPRPRPRPRTT